jgi:hypothetical protein
MQLCPEVRHAYGVGVEITATLVTPRSRQPGADDLRGHIRGPLRR